MNTERLKVTKRVRHVSIQKRFTRKGKVRHIVRWTEDIDGLPERLCQSFRIRDDALVFSRECELKLGIVHSAKSMMADKMRPAGDLSHVIALHIEVTKSNCFERSKNYKNLARYLNPLPEKFGWRRTTDIPANAFAMIHAEYKARGTYTVRAIQRSLHALIKAQWDAYAFDPDICEKDIQKHKAKMYYFWLDEEKDLILRELCSPLRYPEETVGLNARKLKALRRSALCDFAKRQALFPVIWLQIHWALRPGETTLLQVKDWHSRSRELVLSEEITKTGESRTIGLDLVTARILDLFTVGRAPSEFLFRTAYGMPWDGYNEMSRQFKEILVRLGLRGSLYSCRHYAVTTLLELMPGNIRGVMAISGHATLESLARYIGIKGDRKAPAARAYDDVFGAIILRLMAETVGPGVSPSARSGSGFSKENEASIFKAIGGIFPALAHDNGGTRHEG